MANDKNNMISTIDANTFIANHGSDKISFITFNFNF